MDDIAIFPPFTALDRFDLPQNISVGVQNCYPVKNGSFTGEIGLDQLKEFGVETILIGHSERRHILGESQELAAEKFRFFAQNGFEIFYCIGEPLGVRQNGFEATIWYICDQLKGIDLEYDKLVLAYEPVWAIGTGVSATIETIEQTHEAIKKIAPAPLLYGGSVKEDNIASILKLGVCDGALIGTASWNVKSFCNMIEISKKVQEEGETGCL